MDITRLSRLLGVGSAALPETSALDAEGLRLGAALAIIRQGGDLEHFAGSRAEMLALVMTATKRGLIAWDRGQARYDLTRLGEAHVRTYYAHPAHPQRETEPDDESESLFEVLGARLSDVARGAIAGAASVRRALVSALKGSAGSRLMMSGKTVALLAGAAALAGVAVGASFSSSRLSGLSRVLIELSFMKSPWAYSVMAATILIDAYLLYVFFAVRKSTSNRLERPAVPLTPDDRSGRNHRIPSQTTEPSRDPFGPLGTLLGYVIAIAAIATLAYAIGLLS
jgi:hypothetical protein